MKKLNLFSSYLLMTVCLAVLICSGEVRADYKYMYHDNDEVVAIMEALEAQSDAKPEDIYSLQVIGESYLGNPIYAVKFSDNPSVEEDR